MTRQRAQAKTQQPRSELVTLGGIAAGGGLLWKVGKEITQYFNAEGPLTCQILNCFTPDVSNNPNDGLVIIRLTNHTIHGFYITSINIQDQEEKVLGYRFDQIDEFGYLVGSLGVGDDSKKYLEWSHLFLPWSESRNVGVYFYKPERLPETEWKLEIRYVALNDQKVQEEEVPFCVREPRP